VVDVRKSAIPRDEQLRDRKKAIVRRPIDDQVPIAHNTGTLRASRGMMFGGVRRSWQCRIVAR
jgi:hypothetical protein